MLPDYSLIPAVPNRQLAVTELCAYTQKSVVPGTVLEVRACSPSPYRLSVVRLGWDLTGPARDRYIGQVPELPAQPRTIGPGSYVHVERALPATALYQDLTLECWVRPFAGGWQGLISQYSQPERCGFGLFLAPADPSATGLRAACYFSERARHDPRCLVVGRTALALARGTDGNHPTWVHLAAVFSSGQVALYVDGRLDAEGHTSGTRVVPGTAPLRLGARGIRDGSTAATVDFLQGDLALPAIYARALDAVTIAERARTRSRQPAGPDQVLGFWPLREEHGAQVADHGPISRHGTIVNRGTWMIGGPGFDAGAVTDDPPYVPDADPTRGHGLRLSASDLYDFGWSVSCAVPLPADLDPGLYVVRLDDAAGHRFDSTFVVRRAPDRPPAPIGVLCATHTWLAYNDESWPGAYSFYRDHPGGQPAYQVGLAMPWPSADPYATYGSDSYGHLVRAERHLHVWLEQTGYPFDVFDDGELGRDPTLLDEHRVLIIAGHSEYWSREAYTNVAGFVARGGQLLVLSGNTMFWRVSSDGEVVECRKNHADVGGSAWTQLGELYHQHDHGRGGLMREAGCPAWTVTGLECVGYNHGGEFGPYQVRAPDHPLFREPERLGLAAGDALGVPEAVRHEYDVRLQLVVGAPAAPAHYRPVVLASRHVARPGPNYFDYHGTNVASTGAIISEVIDWRRGAGRVFAAGSINAAGAALTDRNLAGLYRNVLHHMGVVFRLNVLAVDHQGRLLNRWYDGTTWGPSPDGWEPLGSDFDHPPAGVQWAPGRVGIVAVTRTGTLAFRHSAGGAWSDWEHAGAALRGAPAPVAWGRDRLDVLVAGADDQVHHFARDGGHWSERPPLGETIVGDPSAIAWHGDRLAVAALGKDGHVLYKWRIGGQWYPSPTTWQDLGGTFAQPPTLVEWGGRINLFTVDAAGHAHNRWWDGGQWNPVDHWQDLGGDLSGPISVAVRGGEYLSLFGLSGDGHLRVKWWEGEWGPSETTWANLDGTFTSRPFVASYRGHHVIVVARTRDGHVCHATWDGHDWSGWDDLGPNLTTSLAVFRWVGTG